MTLLISQEFQNKIDSFSSSDMTALYNNISIDEGGDISIDGSNAYIDIIGHLSNDSSSSLYSLIYGSSTNYNDIKESLKYAYSDDSIETVYLHFNSGGGSVSGSLPEISDLILNSSKKTVAIVGDYCCSAAYWIASACDNIYCTTALSTVGSVGIAGSYCKDNDSVVFTNSDSMDKRPDLSTEEGKAIIVSELDDCYKVFASYIAKGRGVPIGSIPTIFGNGKSFLAGEAIERGIVDGMVKTIDNNINGDIKMENKQDFTQELKVAAVDAVANERLRVEAHIELSKLSGDYQLTLDGIKSGEDVNTLWMSKHNNAALVNREIEARDSENVNVPTPAIVDAVDSVEDLKGKMQMQFMKRG